jgi:flagellar basal body-associated protein FliL
MERLRFTNDIVVVCLIILIILLFLKAVFYYMSITKIHHIFLSDENFEKFRNKLSDVLDIFLAIISLFVLFLRKDNSSLLIFLALVFLLKSFLHFFVNYKLYQYTSLNQSNIDKIAQFYQVESFVTNTFLFIATFYMLNIIFINK